MGKKKSKKSINTVSYSKKYQTNNIRFFTKIDRKKNEEIYTLLTIQKKTSTEF
jgi:hypothetical protein